MRIWKRVMVLLFLAIFGTAGYYGYAFYQFTQGIQQPNLVSKAKQPEPLQSDEDSAEPVIPQWDGKERVNILLLGVDRRGTKNGGLPRSDTMMVVSVDPVNKRYDLFSILRDTYVEIPGHGESRINAAIVKGGPELAMKAVSQLTSLPIKHYVITDFEGFKALIDAMGGVTLDVEKNMYYHDPTDDGKYDINLKKGLQTLDGDKALQYVRFRYDATSDYTRTERQRKLVSAVADQLKQGTTLIQLPAILKEITPYIQTNITSMEMLKLAALGLTIDTENPGKYQIPPMGMFRESNRAGSVLIPDIEQVREFVQEKVRQANVTPSGPESETNGQTQGG